MIVAAVGMPGLSVLELTFMLNRLGVTYGVVRAGKLVKVSGKMAKQSLYPVVFHTATMFLRTYKKFGASRVVALVLDNPHTLHHELGLELAGAEFVKNNVVFSQFSEKELKAYLISCKDLNTSLDFERKPYSITNQVLKEYSASSLSALQTFLYKIKDVETRDNVSKVVKKWMTSDAPFTALEPKLKRAIPTKSLEALKAIVNTPSMKVFREAVRKVAVQPARLHKIAKAYKVNAFDIKYLLSTTA